MYIHPVRPSMYTSSRCASLCFDDVGEYKKRDAERESPCGGNKGGGSTRLHGFDCLSCVPLLLISGYQTRQRIEVLQLTLRAQHDLCKLREATPGLYILSYVFGTIFVSKLSHWAHACFRARSSTRHFVLWFNSTACLRTRSTALGMHWPALCTAHKVVVHFGEVRSVYPLMSATARCLVFQPAIAWNSPTTAWL